MLQVFHVDVTKVDQKVVYVAMAIHVCCKHLFQMFQLFQTYVTRVLSECCICFTLYVASVFIRMLQVFHLDVAYVLQWRHSTYFPRVSMYVASILTVSDVCCKCFL
jgi:hypothetical protein